MPTVLGGPFRAKFINPVKTSKNHIAKALENISDVNRL
jgi:hypothetical protein